jgi:TusA-related sulfurtransferase
LDQEQEHKPDKELDCMGLLCPIPVVKTKRAIKGMEIGQVLEMIATDPGVVPDMEAWERQTRHEILSSEEPQEGVFRFLIKKTH